MREPEFIPATPIAKFETTRGTVRILTAVYDIPGTDKATRIAQAMKDAEYRAEQLEPSKPKRERMQRRESGVYIGENEAALMRGEALR